ncbi:MAG: hypothetical protein AB1714_27435 [Acidobacteriota bacterium]
MRRGALFHTGLYVLVFATGAAGLIYQVTWQKYLSRLLGSDCVATAIVLAVFLGGLSTGYYVCGKATVRVKNHFKAYAILEGIIGVWAVEFPVIFSIVQRLSAGWSFSPSALMVIEGVLCTICLIGVPTVCMGATIPFLTRAVSRNIREATNVHATIYAVNTAGAFVGTLAAGFLLIPVYGLPPTIMGAAFLNFAAFLFFYLASPPAPDGAGSEASGPESPGMERQAVESLYPPWALYVVAFMSGFYVMTLENTLIRFTNLSIGSSSYSFSMIVSVFILAIACGGYAVGRLRDVPRNLLFVNQLAISILLLVVYVTLDTWPYWAHVIRTAYQANFAGFWGYHATVFAALAALLLVPVGFMGATVPIAFHELKRDLRNVGRHSGLLFSCNTLGSLLGSLIGGIAFFYFLDNARVFTAAFLLASCSTFCTAWFVSRKSVAAASIVTAVAVICVVFAPMYNRNHFAIGTFLQHSPMAHSYDGPDRFFEEYLRGLNVKFAGDGPTGSVTVIEGAPLRGAEKRPLSIVINGKSDSSTIGDMYTLKLSAHVPALFAAARRNIMVIGLGTGVTAGELALYSDAGTIDVAEISETVVRALPSFRDFAHGIEKDARVRIHVADAFRVIGRGGKKWDVITSEPSNLWVTGVDLLFSEEFYQLAKNHLTDDGILAQWVHVYLADTEMLGIIMNTIRQEFREVRVFMMAPGDLLFVCSNKPLGAAEIGRAARVIESNPKVKESLSEIDMPSIDAILLREIFPSGYLVSGFAHLGTEVMDYPRLHYIAGRRMFMGSSVPLSFLFGSDSAAYSSQFLMAQKYTGWAKGEAIGLNEYGELLNSLRLKFSALPNAYLPMGPALQLRAFLGDPASFPLSYEEQREYGLRILPFVTAPREDAAWGAIGLDGAPSRTKAEQLLDHVRLHRNWIVPYPIEGLKDVLRKGMSEGDVYDQNWCALQLVSLLVQERAGAAEVKAVSKVVRVGPDGRALLREQDKGLLRLQQAAEPGD